MDLDDLLRAMDRTAANLSKLDSVWEAARPYIPTAPSAGSTQEYETLRLSWDNLLPGLPPIDGWTVTAALPDIDAAGRSFIDYADIGMPPWDLLNELEEPGQQLNEYKVRLGRARSRAIRSRLDELTQSITSALQQGLRGLPDDGGKGFDAGSASEIEQSVVEIERLLGDTIERRGRWGDLRRHLRFAENHDWHDIQRLDWPSVREDIERASFADDDPLPVPQIDLGESAAARPTGGVSTALSWSRLRDNEFERLLFDLISHLPGYQNVQWLMKTNAPDRGRDISAERLVVDAGGTTRTERTIIQAKHWTSRSVGPVDVNASLASLSIWEPPVIRVLIIATSGRFTADGVAVAEEHNDNGLRPFIELWAESRLETLLSERPGLRASYGLDN